MSYRGSASMPFPSDFRHTPGAFPDSRGYADDDLIASDLISLSRAVKARSAEYTRRREILIKVGTWNVAALPGPENDVGKWFVEHTGLAEDSLSQPTGKAEQGQSKKTGTQDNGNNVEAKAQDHRQSTGEDIQDLFPWSASAAERVGIYILGLQEIVDVSSPTEALRPYVDPVPSNKWKEAIQKSLPREYELISANQLVGLLLLIYATPSVARDISSVSTTYVGTGLIGYMGNKGAVATRIVIGGTTRLAFINSHLAAGADKASLERRNWDASQILSRTRFDPVETDDDIGDVAYESIGSEDFAFWFGDLNYRLDGIPGEDVRRLLHLHTENEYDILRKLQTTIDEENEGSTRSPEVQSSTGSRPSSAASIVTAPVPCDGIDPHLDPTSLQATLSSLLPHDQLRAQQRSGKAFHNGWREADIKFLPTYKYDVGSMYRFDSSEKQRSPSWCDRILYRTRRDRLEFERTVKEAQESKRRDEEMKSLGLEQEAKDESVLFDYDPDLDGANDLFNYDENEDGFNDTATAAENQSGSEDLIQISHYRSHQGIMSSDHKPVDAKFILTYDAVIPELKAKVHQQVVRELDKAENEARPGITVVVDRQPDDPVDMRPGEEADDPNAVDFGEVRYDVPVSRSLTLANTSAVPATFSFQRRPASGGETARITPTWLHLRVDWPADSGKADPKAHPEYTLAPGESAHVQLILCIYDISFVRDLNHGNAIIDDILVLRVINGRDHFIPVHGAWLPSCFGFSLEELTIMPEEGARHLQVTSGSLRSTGSSGHRGSRLSGPRELFRLTEAIGHLTERSIAEWDMVGEDSNADQPPWKAESSVVGWPFEADTWTLQDRRRRYTVLSDVREALDTNTPFTAAFPPEMPSRHRVELLAETLLSFLSSLSGGVITETLWQELEQQMLLREKSRYVSTSIEESQSWILEILSSSPVHSVSFTFLTFMLARIANEIAPVSPTGQAIPQSPTTPESSTAPILSHPESAKSFPVPPLSPSTPSSTPFGLRLKTRTRTSSSSATHEPLMPKTSPAFLRRQVVNKSFAAIFAGVVFSDALVPPERERERRIWEDRRRSILEPFLKV